MMQRRADETGRHLIARNRLKATYVIITTLLFSAPYIGIFYFEADALTLGNESLAYRFLYSDRLLDGEGATIWVLAGFLTTAVQNGLLRMIDFVATPDASHLMQRMQLFSWATYGVHVLAVAVILTASARTVWLSWTERLLLAFVTLGPLYLTRTVGFYYFTLPDYYLTNVVLTAAAVCVFQREWRRPDTAGALRRSAVAGLLAGAMVANKITMLPFACVMLAPIVSAGRTSIREALERSALAGLSAACTAVFVLGAFYAFQWSAIVDMFAAWSRTVMNPGGEQSFWSQYFVSYLTQYGYGYIIGLWLLTSIFAAWSVRTAESRARGVTVLFLNVLTGAMWLYFVYKRPAGTTAFEGVVALLGLTASGLTITSRQRIGQGVSIAVLIASTAVAVTTFRYEQNIGTLRQSGPWAKEVWKLHHELLAFAAGRGIIVIHPENHYGYGGLPEFLLKGSADTPTWNVSPRGERVLDRYAPGMRFRHEYSGTPPTAPLPAGVVVYWVDVPAVGPLDEKYPFLRAIEANPRNLIRRWTVPIQASTLLTVHAVILHDPVE